MKSVGPRQMHTQKRKLKTLGTCPGVPITLSNNPSHGRGGSRADASRTVGEPSVGVVNNLSDGGGVGCRLRGKG